MKSDPWAALAMEAAGGSHEAFAKLYRAFWSKVMTVCRHHTDNEEDARDAAQMTFIMVHRYIHNFRGDSLFSTWLHRVAKNEGLTIVRKNKSRPQLINNADDLVNEEQLAHQQPDRLPLLQALDCLTPHQLNILRLHLGEGYTYEEISKMLGISVTASKSVMHQARLKITAALGRPMKEFHARKKEKRLFEAESRTQDQKAFAQAARPEGSQTNDTAA